MPSPFGRVAAPPPHFPVGGPVPGADLVGRETYIRRIGERLNDGNHVLLAGPRRIGKTSIILEVLRRLRRRGAYTAYVDCLGATDVRGLGERLADALLENVSGAERSFEQAKAIAAGMRPTVKVKYEHVELALDLAREKNAQRFFEGALDLPRVLAARSGKRVVVVFDEFQAAGRLGPRVFDVMRARFQAQRGVAYAFLVAAAAVDRELAANLELASMFDQTHQVALFENGEFARHGATLRDDPAAFAAVESVYARIADTETAMARRGPANTIRPEDVALIEGWEGDVREAQRRLRAAASAPEPSAWAALIARLRGGRPAGR